jgi:dihydroneopterin aldolase
MDKIFIHGLTLQCVIGVYPEEREKKQTIILDLEFVVDTKQAAISDKLKDTVDYDAIIQSIENWVSYSNFNLLEALAEFLAERLMQNFKLSGIRMKLCKKIPYLPVTAIGIEICRGRIA